MSVVLRDKQKVSLKTANKAFAVERKKPHPLTQGVGINVMTKD